MPLLLDKRIATRRPVAAPAAVDAAVPAAMPAATAAPVEAKRALHPTQRFGLHRSASAA